MSCEKLMNGYSAPIIYILYHSIILSFLKPAANFIYSIKLGLSAHSKYILTPRLYFPATSSLPASSLPFSQLAAQSSQLSPIPHLRYTSTPLRFVLYIAARSVRLWKSSVYLKYTLKGGCHDYLVHFCEHSDVILL